MTTDIPAVHPPLSPAAHTRMRIYRCGTPTPPHYAQPPTGCGAAWLARRSGGPKVPGSNPGSPTTMEAICRRRFAGGDLPKAICRLTGLMSHLKAAGRCPGWLANRGRWWPRPGRARSARGSGTGWRAQGYRPPRRRPGRCLQWLPKPGSRTAHTAHTMAYP